MSMSNKMEELCWLYVNSKSYEEFDIKRSIECPSCSKRWKFMDIFWWYTLNKNCVYNVLDSFMPGVLLVALGIAAVLFHLFGIKIGYCLVSFAQIFLLILYFRLNRLSDSISATITRHEYDEAKRHSANHVI